MVKNWLITALLTLPALAWPAFGTEDGQQIITVPVEGTGSEHSADDSVNWVDNSHAYATNQAQALTEWMDGFFFDPSYELEKPESLMRLEWVNEWDEEDDARTRARLRGKIQLPALSKRLNLVFSGEDGDRLSEEDRETDNNTVGLWYNVGERNRSRVDLTMGFDTWEVRPGVRYRNQGPITDVYSYRYTQHLEYDDDNRAFTTGQVNLDRALAEDQLVRWSNRVVYGQETDGAEWRSILSLRQRMKPIDDKYQFVISYFAAVNGVTDPNYTKNTRFGVQLRRQLYRQFLFAELEPSYNFRKREDEDRSGVWNIVLRFEVALERDLRRHSKRSIKD